MQEVEVRITSVCPPGGQGGIRAYASATIGGCFGVRGIKIVEGGRDGLFVSMPSRKTVDGYSEVCFPVTAEFREQLYGKVLGAYRQVMREVQTAAGIWKPTAGTGRRSRVCADAMKKWRNGKMGKWRNQVRKAHTAVVMKVWEAKTKLAETSGEGYVDTAVKILIAVVLGALLLAGLYALFNDTVLPTLTNRVKEMFDYAG